MIEPFTDPAADLFINLQRPGTLSRPRRSQSELLSDAVVI
jgi:hypothetical protein